MSALEAVLRPGTEPGEDDLVGQTWDVVVVGGGHNGLTAASYLARAGMRVLVLERRDRIGGAATVEEPWPGYLVSPCAYVVGLLHERVVAELGLERRGYQVTMFDPQLYVPLEDGSVFVEWRDDERTAADLAKWAPSQVEGWRALAELQHRVKEALRPEGEDDLWLRWDPPSREEVEARLGHDPVAVAAVFEDSIEALLRRFFDDHRLVDALAGQGVIGSASSPRGPGTAWINFHHSLGRVGDGRGGWGFVHGGIGLVSAAIANAAVEAGALIALNREVSSIRPGAGVELENGSFIRGRAVVSNATPQATLQLLGDEASAEFRERVDAVPCVGASAKVNYALSGLPSFPHDIAWRSTINVGASVEGLHSSAEASRRGELSDRIWAELYLQSPYDPTVVPEGKHLMSCFAQYVPFEFANGTWDTRRSEVSAAITQAIERFAPGFGDLIDEVEVSGPPDIERKIGLTGGHIFQGECLPEFMWERRVPYRTGVAGVYLCGAGTYPGGSVIAVNGRNAALCLLEDLG